MVFGTCRRVEGSADIIEVFGGSLAISKKIGVKLDICRYIDCDVKYREKRTCGWISQSPKSFTST